MAVSPEAEPLFPAVRARIKRESHPLKQSTVAENNRRPLPLGDEKCRCAHHEIFPFVRNERHVETMKPSLNHTEARVHSGRPSQIFAAGLRKLGELTTYDGPVCTCVDQSEFHAANALNTTAGSDDQHPGSLCRAILDQVLSPPYAPRCRWLALLASS